MSNKLKLCGQEQLLPQKRNLSHQKLQTIPTSSQRGTPNTTLNPHCSQLSTHITVASWELLKLSPPAQMCPWQRCCPPGSAPKAQPSLFLPSTLHISDDLEQRVRAVIMTKLPNREDEQEGTEASEQSRAALAPVPSTGNALRDTMTAAPPSPGDRAPAARQEVPRLCQAVRSLCVPLVTSDRSTHAGNRRGSTRPPAATGATGAKCHPATGQLPPQDTFLPQLFIHKAPKKQTPWFVQTEMWHLLTKNWVVTVQKHLHIPASQKTILEIQAIFHWVSSWFIKSRSLELARMLNT